MALQTFTNTRYFSEAAIGFKRDGVYCKAPKGHPEYREFWAIQKQRSLFGYSVGDLSITGRHYFYLNFCPIKRAEVKRGSGNDEIASPLREIKGMQAKQLLFPNFWEVDYNWWWAKEIAMHGMLKEDVIKLQVEGLPIIDYLTGKHLACLKTRRGGFSYKEAADGVYNYNFIPNSISYYFAAKDDYLTKDGILNKVKLDLDHLNSNTQGFWLKNRMEKNTIMHQKASYLDKKRNPAGYMSEIIGVIVNDPEKVRGKDGIKVTYEEAGSFKNLKKAIEISAPSFKDGDIMTGQMSIFGTGGEEGPDIEGLEDVFTTPAAWDILEFNNIWEEGMESTTCGYYVPCYMTYSSFMDEDGNIDKEGALNYDDLERDKKKLLKDPKQLDRRVAEYSRTPSEALQRLSKNIFPVAEILPWLRQLQINKDLTADILHGILYQDAKTKKVQFKPEPDAKPIWNYPHNQEEDLSGCVTMYEPIITDRFGIAIEGLYDVVVDPYYKDQAEDLTSLWVAKLIMHKTKEHPEGDKVVAEYIGRPLSLETCYRNTYFLSELGNCKIQSEIAGGGQGLYVWLKSHGKLYKCHFAPTQFSTKENTNEKNRSIFMNLSGDEKTLGLSYYASWLMKPRGITPAGNIIYNFHMIRSIPDLQEIVKYNGIRNADRISTMIIAQFMFKEHIIEETKVARETHSDFFDRPGFTSEFGYGEQTISLDNLIL